MTNQLFTLCLLSDWESSWWAILNDIAFFLYYMCYFQIILKLMRFYVAAGGDGMKAAVGEFFLL